MRKKFTILSLALSLGIVSASAAAPKVAKMQRIAPAVKERVATNGVEKLGAKKYDLSLLSPVAKFKAQASAAAVVSEDFSKFTAGSEATPDATDLCDFSTSGAKGEISSQYTQMPGWSGFGVFQAGGSAYIGVVEYNTGSQEPGYINTPTADLSANNGFYKVKFRAKSAVAVGDVVYVISLKGDGTESYQAIEISNEWKEYVVSLQGDAQTYVQLYSYNAAAYFDDIEITSDGLAAPSNVAVTDYVGTSATVSWDAVAAAESYIVTLYYGNYDQGSWDIVRDIPTTETSVQITGLDASKDYAVKVASVKGGEKSISDLVQIKSDLAVPENVATTNVTPTSFTLSWSPVEGATSYIYAVGHYSNYEMVYDAQNETTATSVDISNLDLYSYTYFVVVAAVKDEVVGDASEELAVSPTIKAPVAKPATNLTANGFTASWDAVEFGQYYLPVAYREHTAAAAESFDFLNTDFSDVVSSGTVEQPEESFSSYSFTQDGWAINYAAFANGMVGIDASLSYFGMYGYLVSPDLDFSHNGGKATVKMRCVGASGATNLLIAFQKNVGGGKYEVVQSSIQQVEIPTTMSDLKIEMTGGDKATCIYIMPASGILMIDDMQVSTTLASGDVVSLPMASGIVEGATTYDFKDLALPQGDKLFYNVQAALLADGENITYGEISNNVYVDLSGAVEAVEAADAAKVYVADGVLHIVNPMDEAVEVYNAGGALVASPDASEVVLPSKGVYVVRIGAKAFKVMN